MTANQIAYQKHLEDKRHNFEMERYNQRSLNETKRANISKELETVRSNKAREVETHRANTETARSNRARERETERHNVIGEFHTAQSLTETNRHNVSTENMTNFMNAQTAANMQNQYSVAKQNADTNWYNAQTNRYAQEENARHNYISEQLTGTKYQADILIDQQNANSRTMTALGNLWKGFVTPSTLSKVKFN